MRLLTVFFIVAVSSAAGQAPDSDATPVVENFLALLTSALEASDYETLASYIDDKFIFKGCTMHLNKDQLMAMLSKIPAGGQFSFDLVKARYLRNNFIEYTVDISALGKQFRAMFALRDSNLITFGKVPGCDK